MTRVLGDEDGLEKSLKALEDAVNEALEVLAGRSKEVPRLLEKAAAPLAAGDLAVGDATERAKTADTLVPVLAKWCRLGRDVLGRETWLAALGKVAEKAKDQGGMDAADQQTFVSTAITLSAVRGSLFDAEDARDLDRIRASARIETAIARLAYLSAKYQVPEPTPDRKPADYDLDPTKLGGAKTTFDTLIESPDPLTMENVETMAWVMDQHSASPIKLTSTRRWLVVLDVVALLVTVGVAIVAGLSAFYFGESFGTLEDYLTVIVVGTAAQVVAKAVLDQLAIFWHDISPDQKFQGATVTLKTAS